MSLLWGIIIKPQRTSLKQRIAGGARTYIMCVLVSAIIYLFVVVENAYQGLLEGKADAYTITAWILFIGFLIFLIVKISPIFGKLLFRMFGVEEEA